MAVGSTAAGQALAGDAAALARLRSAAGSDPKAAVREAARQFEALFMQEVMKSLRAATLASGSLDNEGSKLGTEMLDQQFAQQLAGLPGGLGDAIVRQLERQMGAAAPLLVPGGSADGVQRQPAASAGPAGAPNRNAEIGRAHV